MPAASSSARNRPRSPSVARGRLAVAILLLLLPLAIMNPAAAGSSAGESIGRTTLAASGGTISGRATRADGKGAAAVEVRAYERLSNEHSEWLEDAGVSTVTAVDGTYTLTFSRDGRYVVYFLGSSGQPWSPFVPEFYGETFQGASAPHVVVADGAALTGVDVDLDSEQTEWVTIDGSVTDPGGSPLPRVEVIAYCPDDRGTFVLWGSCRTAQTDAQGHYVLEMLSRGEYRLGFFDLDGVYPSEYFDNVDDVHAATSVFATQIAEAITMSMVQLGTAPVETISVVDEPSISGTATVGKRLLVDSGQWSPSEVTLAYQWLRNGAPIPGATAEAYRPIADDHGAALAVQVTASTASGASLTVVTDPQTVRPGRLLESTAPTLLGGAKVGLKLRIDKGVWRPSPVQVAVQWLRAGSPITGATGNGYRLGRADRGKVIAASLTVTKSGYTTVTRVVKSRRIR